MERSCRQCDASFEAARADKIYCSGACKQAAVRARRGVRVARRPPGAQPDELLKRLVEIEGRQQDLLTELDHLEGKVGEPQGTDQREALTRRGEGLEERLELMAKEIKAISIRLRKHEAALTQFAELLAAEPWRRR